MEKFTTVTGIGAPFFRNNVNTDAIIPGMWLPDLTVDLGEKLFANWRYDLQGKEFPDFVLNREPYRKARFLVSGVNFGCGSSREQAPLALLRFGMRAVIAPSYSDIFFANCFQTGLLAIRLDEATCKTISDVLETNPEMTIDLEKREVRVATLAPIVFEIDEELRQSLLRGMDEISMLLAEEKTIQAFEDADRLRRPWVTPLRGAANPPV